MSGTNPDEDTKGKENGRGLRGRSNEIAVDRAAAVKAAESVLGPLSALADSSHLYTATATAVLDRRGLTAVPTAVLQLLPLSRGTDAVGSGGEWVPLLRRVTISISGRPTEQFTDRVEVARLTLDLHPGDDDTFEWRENYTPRLLPQPLIELLAATNPEAPIRLMIVPTGFFHIPFDALPVTADTAVLDHALVSIHGSLTSALSLMALDEQRTPTPSLALYDHTLTHARPELDTLLAALDGVRRVESHQDLDLEMSVDGAQPYSLLAMAVHGSADEHGWGQAKKLRDADGNTVWVTAAQALSWTVPRLCVLASCNTPISAPDGIEIGGFPLALMLRGATTVIGGLYNIDDKATSAIMIAFWNRLA
ncbi:CHAT domain-containing protein, partial [Streptomyces sp. NPDC018955]|uniref:CHAT domain-containing protein n=1 Tax=Streptomyces sp. NPDC018955 TaxID=3365055 RepID=UPI003797E402